MNAASAVTLGMAPARLHGLVGALPVSNSIDVPGAQEHGTTIVTLLFAKPSLPSAVQTELAHQYVKTYLDRASDHVVGVGGAVPAREAQSSLISRNLQWIELGTILIIGLVLAWGFRALGPPLLALAVAGVAYLLVRHVGTFISSGLGVSLPAELEPLIVASAARHTDGLGDLLAVRGPRQSRGRRIALGRSPTRLP